MPYFVYRITRSPLQMLEKMGEFGKFPEASNQAKLLRADADPARQMLKVVHAENELHAEDLLSQVRVATPGSRDEE